MSKEQILPLYYKDFFTSTSEWSDTEVGQYVRLLLRQWDEGAISPELERFKNAATSVQKKFKEVEPGKLQNPKMEKVREIWNSMNVTEPKKKAIKKVATQKEVSELVFPFHTTEFTQTWAQLMELKKWKTKTQKTLQENLKFLSEHSHNDAIEIMKKTIRGNWQGLFKLHEHEKRITNQKGSGSRFTEAKSQISQLADATREISKQRGMLFDTGGDEERQP